MARSRTVTSTMWPPPSGRTATVMRSAEGKDEQRLPVLDGCAAGDEDLADLAVRGSADLRDVAERLDPAEHDAARDGVSRVPRARGVEDADGRRVDTLRLLDRDLSVAVPPRRGRGRTAAMPRDRDREP